MSETQKVNNGSKVIGDYSNGRANNFDFIRFMAAASVIYWHSFSLGAGSGGEGDIIYSLTKGSWNSGGIAVAIFFVVSGFLITQSYDFSKSFLKFVKARLLRIFPALIVVIFLSSFILGPIATSLSLKEYFFNSQTYQYLKAILLYPMEWFLPGVFENNIYKGTVNGSLWTIPFEVLCYGIVALIGLLGLLKYRKGILLIYLSTMFVLIYEGAMFPAGRGTFLGLQLTTLTELFSFFSAGMLFYIYRNSIPHDKHLAMISIIMLFLGSQFGGIQELFTIFGSYLIFYFAFTPKLKIHNFSRYGDFSYGLYIYAFPIQQLVTHYYGGQMNSMTNFVISLAITLIFAILSWHLVEKHALRLKRYHFINVNSRMSFNVGRRGSFLIHKFKAWLSKREIMTWKVFTFIAVTLLVIFSFLSQKPSEIIFPNDNSSVFYGNWLPQNSTESYRWINKSAGVILEKPNAAKQLIIEGYVPETFNEVKKVSYILNKELLIELEVVAGQPINTTIDLSQLNIVNGEISLMIEFNDSHKPKKEDADQREMSGMVSKIYFK